MEMMYRALCLIILYWGSAAKASDNGCPKTWSYYHVDKNEYCMKVFSSNQAILRQQANDQCKTHGSNLVSLHSTKEENFMRALMAFESATVQDLTFWIGLRCQHNSTFWPESKQMLPIDLQIRITSCIFSWSDNSGSGNYRNWVTNSLTDNAAQSDKRECAAYSELDDGWVRAHCDSERHRGYVCKKTLGEESHGTETTKSDGETSSTKSNSETSAIPTTSSTTPPKPQPKRTKIMLIGGYNRRTTYLATTETYVPDHPEQNSLSGATLKFPGHCIVAGYLGGDIVAAGGYSASAKHKQTEQYIPSQNRWKALDGLDMLWYTQCPAYATHNDMLYVFGGTTTDQRTTLASAQRLNWERKRWEPVMHMPKPRCYARSLVYKNDIYISGGFDPWPSPEPNLYKYSPSMDAYTELEPMETPRFGHGFAIFNDLFYVCGGAKWTQVFMKTCEVYHPEHNYWRSVPSLMSVRYGGDMFTINGKLLAIGGENQVDQYDPEAQKWIAKTRLKAARAYFAAILL